MQQIIPSPGARGTHAFHPSLADTPSLVIDDDDDQGHDESLGIGKEIGGSASNVETAVAGDASLIVHTSNPLLHSSISYGKRKFSALS